VPRGLGLARDKIPRAIHRRSRGGTSGQLKTKVRRWARDLCSRRVGSIVGLAISLLSILRARGVFVRIPG